MAEAFGVLLGDGCLSRTLQGGSWASQVAFTANPSEFRYYQDFIQPTIESVFGVRGHLYLRDDNTTRYHIASAELVLKLHRLGFPIGKKRDASIPKCVFRSGQIVPFIRGLYHAEGSIYRRYSKRYKGHARVYSNLLNIQIRMKLPTLMRQVHGEINRLGIATNRLTAKAGVYTLRITRQEMVRKFFDIIKPRYKLTPHPANL